MANNYLQFSFLIPDLTFDETAWVREIISIDIEDDDYDNPRGLGQFADDPEYFGANVEFDPDGLWIYADESGSPDDAAAFVQAFLAKHRPDYKVGFTWASTCSKPRINEFDGGGAVVSATGTTWMNASRWVDENLKG